MQPHDSNGAPTIVAIALCTPCIAGQYLLSVALPLSVLFEVVATACCELAAATASVGRPTNIDSLVPFMFLCRASVDRNLSV